jgi:hypothetical protein
MAGHLSAGDKYVFEWRRADHGGDGRSGKVLNALRLLEGLPLATSVESLRGTALGALAATGSRTIDVAFSPSGGSLASLDDDGDVQLWKTADGPGL